MYRFNFEYDICFCTHIPDIDNANLVNIFYLVNVTRWKLMRFIIFLISKTFGIFLENITISFKVESFIVLELTRRAHYLYFF